MSFTHEEKMELAAVRERAMKYVEPLTNLFRDEMGNRVPPRVIYQALVISDLYNYIHPLLTSHGRHHTNSGFHETEYLSPLEQYQKLNKKLYDQAMSGDVAANKEWEDRNMEAQKEQIFNVVVNVKDYTINDKSLRRIASMSERHFVDDMLGGLEDRLAYDLAPKDLQDLLADFRERFMAWAYTAYSPKDG